MSNRTVVWNGYEDTLSAELASGELTNVLVSAIPVGWVGPVVLCIEPDVPGQREWIRAVTVNEPLARFETLTRNLVGSVGDLTHPINSIVRCVVSNQLIDDLFDDIEALEAADIAHDALPSIHHTKYLDADAVSAMGSLDDANDLNHNRYTDAEADVRAALLDHDHATPIATHAALPAEHHAKYTDGEADARAALQDHDHATPIATHAGDVDAHHVKYLDAEAAAKIAADDLYVKNTGDTVVGDLFAERFRSTAGLNDTTWLLHPFWISVGAPTAQATGDMWLDQTSNSMKRWNGSVWEVVLQGV